MHGMAHRFVLLADPRVRLVVLLAASRLAVGRTLIQEVAGELEVGSVARDPIELDQRHLGDLMAGPHRALARTKGVDQQVCRSYRDLEQRSLPRGPVVGSRGLVQMAQVVQFVAQIGISSPALAA